MQATELYGAGMSGSRTVPALAIVETDRRCCKRNCRTWMRD